jgi:hypothetical protein
MPDHIPSPQAMRAARQIIATIRANFAHATRQEHEGAAILALARIIDAEFAPMRETLESLMAEADKNPFTCIGHFVEHMSNARAALGKE